MQDDALYRQLLALRKEEPDDIRRFIREALYRDESGLPQVDPNVWFHAPAEWEPPTDVQRTYDVLSDPGENIG